MHHASAIKYVFDVSLLRQVETSRSALDINAEKEPKFTEVLDGKLSMEAINNALEDNLTGNSKDHVINIKKVGDIRTTLQDKQQGVRTGWPKTKFGGKSGKTIDPCPRGLPKAIE